MVLLTYDARLYGRSASGTRARASLSLSKVPHRPHSNTTRAPTPNCRAGPCPLLYCAPEPRGEGENRPERRRRGTTPRRLQASKSFSRSPAHQRCVASTLLHKPTSGHFLSAAHAWPVDIVNSATGVIGPPC